MLALAQLVQQQQGAAAAAAALLSQTIPPALPLDIAASFAAVNQPLALGDQPLTSPLMWPSVLSSGGHASLTPGAVAAASAEPIPTSFMMPDFSEALLQGADGQFVSRKGSTIGGVEETATNGMLEILALARPDGAEGSGVAGGSDGMMGEGAEVGMALAQVADAAGASLLGAGAPVVGVPVAGGGGLHPNT